MKLPFSHAKQMKLNIWSTVGRVKCFFCKGNHSRAHSKEEDSGHETVDMSEWIRQHNNGTVSAEDGEQWSQALRVSPSTFQIKECSKRSK